MKKLLIVVPLVFVLLTACGVTANKKMVITAGGEKMTFVTNRPVSLLDTNGAALEQAYQVLGPESFGGWYKKVVFVSVNGEKDFYIEDVDVNDLNPKFQDGTLGKTLIVYFSDGHSEFYFVSNDPSFNSAGILFYGRMSEDSSSKDHSVVLSQGGAETYLYLEHHDPY